MTQKLGQRSKLEFSSQPSIMGQCFRSVEFLHSLYLSVSFFRDFVHYFFSIVPTITLWLIFFISCHLVQKLDQRSKIGTPSQPFLWVEVFGTLHISPLVSIVLESLVSHFSRNDRLSRLELFFYSLYWIPEMGIEKLAF